MNRRQLLIGAGALAAYAAIPEWTTGGPACGTLPCNGLPCDEILLFGDSNTYSGKNTDGTVSPAISDGPTNSNCLEYNGSYQNADKNGTLLAFDQLHYNINGANPPGTGYPVGAIGCGMSFMRDWYRLNKLAGNRNVRITVYGIGGTKSGDWTTGETNPSTITRFNNAIAQSGSNVAVLVIVVLGTNDAIGQVGTSTFTSNMQSIASYHRANITGGTNLPILFVGLVPAWVASNTGLYGPYQTALNALPSSISKSAVVDMANLYGAGQPATGQNAAGGVAYHLCAADQIKVGQTGLGNAWGNLSS